MRVARKQGNAPLWNALGVLPLAADLVDTTDGVVNEQGLEYRSEWGWVEIWRADGTAASTITGPITLWGWNGSRWMALTVLSAGNITVSSERGAAYLVRMHGVYSYLALTAANATPTGTTPTISAHYCPVQSH